MVWALLAILGVPIWLVVGGLAASIWSRKQFRKTPGVFRAKVRLESGSFPGLSEKWPKVPSFALWIHDVLLLQRGLALIRTLPVPVASAEGSVQNAEPEAVKRLGENPLLFSYRLDNGAIIQMAAPGDERALACGPFQKSEETQK